MTSERYQRIRSIYFEVSGSPAESRHAVLDRACGGDTELRAEVERLLTSDEPSTLEMPGVIAEDDFASVARVIRSMRAGIMPPSRSDTLASSAVQSLAVSAGAQCTREAPGTLIGPYRLIERIGEGGFGTVFLAEQEQPVRRRVALKIIKPGMDTTQVIARFEAERQALALMDHPFIARVFDAGETTSGRPYFVMELVRGVPISEYCDEANLPLQARLELFIQVCGAIQHAHQKGVIHRDIKPSNVLVAIQDEQPAPKVIDFGIAKATHADLGDTGYTQAGRLMGTPEFMSPEQARGGADIDTRSDVYSLGVVLYRLLTGHLPFDSRKLRSSGSDGIAKMICEVDPPRPSTRLEESSNPGEADAKHLPQDNMTQSWALARQLRGDLDWIALKCLEKDRARRYGSASELAEDLRRHLAGEPVMAAPPSSAYRVRKFVTRNRSSVIAGSLLVLSLLVGATGTTAGMLQARNEAAKLRQAESEQRRLALAESAARTEADARREAEEAQRKAAERAQEQAEAINEFVVKALISADPNQAGAQGTLVSDAMDQAIRQLDAGELRDQPELEAALLLAISRILAGNGRAADALRLAERGLEINEALHRGDHAEVMAGLHFVANALCKIGRPADALVKYEAALDMARRLESGDHLDVEQSLSSLGCCLQALGRPAEALTRHEAALAMRKRHSSGDHPEIAVELSNVASCLLQLGRPAEALSGFEDSIEMRKRLFSGDDPELATSINNTGFCLQSLGQNAEALNRFETALEMRQRLFKGDHPDIAVGLNSVGYCLMAFGRVEEALSKFKTALEMYRRLITGDHPDIARTQLNIGGCLKTLRRHAEALSTFDEALQMQRRLYEGDHPDVAQSLNNIAGCLADQGRHPEALTYYESAMAMRQRLFNDDHPDVANSLNNVAACLERVGRPAEALPKYESAGAMLKRVLPAGHPHMLYPQAGAARCLVAAGRYAEAESLLLEAAGQCERSDASRRQHGVTVLRALVALYSAWDAAEPGQGHGKSVEQWRSRLPE